MNTDSVPMQFYIYSVSKLLSGISFIQSVYTYSVSFEISAILFKSCIFVN